LELSTSLEEILLPRSYALAERYTFQNVRRESSESVRAFAERLLKASDKCMFSNKEERLRDQFVFGLNDKAIIAKLLVKNHDELTFKTAVAEAEAISALKDTQIMHSAPASRTETVMKVGKSFPKAINSPRPERYAEKRTGSLAGASPSSRCPRCGGSHKNKADCPANGKTCRKCGKLNHFERQCKSKSASQHHVAHTEDVLSVAHAAASQGGPGSTVKLTCSVDGQEREITCQLDTGATVSVMSSRLWQNMGRPRLQPCKTALIGYSDNHKFDLLGQLKVRSTWKGRPVSIIFHVVTSDRTFALLGRDVIHVNMESISIGHTQTQNERMLPEESPRRGFKAHLQLMDGATPKYIKARPVPFAVKDKLRAEIDTLLKDGIIEPVAFSSWASPIVLIEKPDGTLRLCVDYKQTVNPQLVNDSYPSPTPEEAFSAVTGCRFYSILDLKKAYNQIELDEPSKDLTVMATPFGNFRYNRLVFGMKTAPSIFQRFITEVINGIEGSVAYVDDILIGGRTKAELSERESAVRDRLALHNLRVNESKCQLARSRVRFLGFILESGTIKPDEEKVRAIQEMAAPKNVAELESLLGLVNFGGRFIKNLAEMMEPLARLKRKNCDFVWTNVQETAFNKIKAALTKSSMLATYDPNKPLELESDASQVAIGGVLSQEGVPIIFISKILSPAERKYSQIEREALAIVWSVRRCHRFLFGRQFSLVTDHRPLTFVFGHHSQLPERVSARLQRWAITLSGYNYVISYRKSADMRSDALSRLVAPDGAAQTHHIGRVMLSEGSMLDTQDLVSHTRKCPELRRLAEAIRTGCFNEPDVRCYKAISDELSVQDGLVIRGSRLVVPISLRAKAVNAAHGVHLGIVRTKSLLREHYWWPGLDKMVEDKVGKCQVCRMAKPQNRNFRTHWPRPEGPWTRVHVDFAGPIEGQYLLVIVDAYSGYPEVHLTKDMLSSTVVSRLRRTFSQLGVPNQLVSDNGPSFVSHETREWLSRVGCTLVTTPAYHPQSNGIAERFVRTIKEAVKANGFSQAAIDRYLLFYRASTSKPGASPAELLFGRQLRAPLLSSSVSWAPGEDLIYRAGQHVQEATLVSPAGTNTAIIKLGDNQFRKAHLDQLQRFRPGDLENDSVRQASTHQDRSHTQLSASLDKNTTASTSQVETHSGEAEPQTAVDRSLTAVACDPSERLVRSQTTTREPEVRRSSRLQDKPRINYKE
jgi:transposase InsO family protein